MVDEQQSSTIKKKVLIVRFSSLGDIVLTFPSIRLLKQNNYEIHYLTKESFKELLSLNSDVDRVLTVSNHIKIRDLINFIKNNLVNENYSNVIDLHNNLRSFLIRLFFKFQKNVQIVKISKERFKTILIFIFKSKISKLFKIKCKPKILLNVELINCLINNKINSEKFINEYKFNLPAQNSYAEKYNKIEKYIVISPDSLWSEKEWDINKFKEIAKYAKSKKYEVIWTASKRNDNIENELGLNLTGKTSLTELMNIVKFSSIVISNDSGIMHIAESFGIRSISIFGPTSKELGFSPHRVTSAMVESNLWCRPCSKSGKLCIRPMQRNLCLKIVNVENVIMNLNKMIGKNENLDL